MFCSEMNDNYSSRRAFRRCPTGPCSSPCAGAMAFAPVLLFFVALPLIPFILRFAWFMLVGHLFATAVFGMGGLLATSCSNESSASPCPVKRSCAKKADDHSEMTSGAVKKSAAMKKSADPAAETPPKYPRRDLSAVRVQHSNDTLTVIVSAPGIHSSDLSVTVLGEAVHVKGETLSGGVLFSIDRELVLPPIADLATVACTHDAGELTVTMARKPEKRVPIAVQPKEVQPGAKHSQAKHTSQHDEADDEPEADAAVAPPPSPAAPVAAAPTPDETTEDEWVPLPKSAQEKKLE